MKPLVKDPADIRIAMVGQVRRPQGAVAGVCLLLTSDINSSPHVAFLEMKQFAWRGPDRSRVEVFGRTIQGAGRCGRFSRINCLPQDFGVLG